jgi:hypothetical protein
MRKILIFLLLCSLFLLFGCKPKPVYLIAKEDMPVFERSEDAARDSGDVAITAKKGERYVVLSCRDLKSRFILEIDIGGGKKGFVGMASYDLSGVPDCL